MSSPKKIGRWNRFEIAFNEGVWPKPSFSPSAPSRASEKTGGLRKIAKETPNAPFADLAPSTETPSKPSPENKTPTENVAPSKKTPGKPSPEEATPIRPAAELKEPPVPDVAASEETPNDPPSSRKTPFGGAASLDATPTEPTPEEPPLSIAAKSPTLWAEARQRAAKAKKSRF